MAISTDNQPHFLQRAKRVEQPSVSESQPTKKTPSFLSRAKQVKFSDEQFVSDEQVQKDIERAQAQSLSRAGEAVLGAPGDIASFITGVFGKEQNILPTSQSLREKSEKFSKGYTKPKNEFEEAGGEVISDITSMALPGSGHYSFARNIGVPVIGNLVKQGLKYNSADEKSQAYGKMGTMVALDLLSRRTGGAKAYASSLFNEADKAIPKGVSVQASGLEKSIGNLEKSLSAGGSRPTTKKALEKIVEIRNEIKNGKVDIKRLAAFRPSINEAIEELGGFQMEVPKKLKPAAIRNLNNVKGEVIKILDEYGQKFNPEYLKAHRSANEAYAAYSKSNVIGNFIRDKVPFSPKGKVVQTLFSYGPVAGVAGLAKLSPLGAAGAVTGAVGYQGFKVLHRVMKSPVLRKYYLNSLKEAAAGNAPAVAKNLKALDKLTQDQEHEEKE